MLELGSDCVRKMSLAFPSAASSLKVTLHFRRGSGADSTAANRYEDAALCHAGFFSEDLNTGNGPRRELVRLAD
jgi:hypothetical protein